VVLATGTLTDAEIDAVRLDSNYEMEDTCRIYEVYEKGELQQDGSMTSDSESEIYTGICSITPIIARRDRFDEFGEGLVYSVQYRLTVPYSVTGVKITHRVEMLTTRDPDFTGRNFEVRDVHRSTDISQRRITLHDIER